MARRHGALEHQLQTLQNANRCQARAVARSKILALCVGRDRRVGQRSDWNAAIAHYLFSPSFVCFHRSEYFCRSVDGGAGICCPRRDCGFSAQSLDRVALDCGRRKDQLDNGPSRRSFHASRRGLDSLAALLGHGRLRLCAVFHSAWLLDLRVDTVESAATCFDFESSRQVSVTDQVENRSCCVCRASCAHRLSSAQCGAT